MHAMSDYASRLAAGLAIAASLKRDAIGRTYCNRELMRRAVAARRQAVEHITLIGNAKEREQ